MKIENEFIAREIIVRNRSSLRASIIWGVLLSIIAVGTSSLSVTLELKLILCLVGVLAYSAAFSVWDTNRRLCALIYLLQQKDSL